MKKYILILILLLNMAHAGVNQLRADLANHTVTIATITKFLNIYIKDERLLFGVMVFVSLAKEVADFDGTGFSFDDLVMDGFGYWLVIGEVNF